MNRRAFLGLAATSAAAFALDPERLLWMPGAKTIFLPSREVYGVTSMAEALQHGLVAVQGTRRMVVLVSSGDQAARELAALEADGWRVVANRQYARHEVGE